MEKAIAFVVVLVICALAVLFLVGWAMDAGTRQASAQANLAYAQGQAEAMILRAQGQNSLDRAEAAAVRAEAFTAKMLAMLPYSVLAVLAILGLAVVALAFVIVTRSPRPVVISYLAAPPPVGQLPEGRQQTLMIPSHIFEELER